MAIGFDSGSKTWDNYNEAVWELRKCHYTSLGWDKYVEHERKEEKEKEEFFEGIYENEFYEKQYKKPIQN